MSNRESEGAARQSAAEIELANEFPERYALEVSCPRMRPRNDEIWARVLRGARHSAQLLADLQERGLKLVRLNQNTPQGTDLQPLYQTLIEWVPRIQDPLTLSVCLGRLLEPGARALVRKNREVLLNLARQWNGRVRECEGELTLSTLAQCVTKVVLERDIPEVIEWSRDSRLPSDARDGYVWGLQRSAKKPGPARDALAGFVTDSVLGPSAVRALAGAAKTDVLPLLRELQSSSPYERVRAAAKECVRKLDARAGGIALPRAKRTMLPRGFRATSIEFDSDRLPELLSLLEREAGGELQTGVAEQLARSAAQLRPQSRRFHIVDLVLGDGETSPLGLELYAEDEDVIALGIHCGPEFEAAIAAALNRFLNDDEAGRN